MLVGSALPTIRLGDGGFIGAGNGQRSFDLDRDLALVPDLLPRSLVIVVPALVLLGAAVAGLRLGSRRPVALAAFAAGIALSVAVYRLETHLTDIGSGGVIRCDQPCAGFVLTPGLRDLQRDLLRTPAGRRPGFELTGGRNGYRANPRPAWRPLFDASLALGLLGGYSLARLAVAPWPAALVTGTVAFLVVVWLVVRALGRSE